MAAARAARRAALKPYRKFSQLAVGGSQQSADFGLDGHRAAMSARYSRNSATSE